MKFHVNTLLNSYFSLLSLTGKRSTKIKLLNLTSPEVYLFSLLVISHSSLSLSIIEVEGVVVIEITLDRIEIDQHIFKLLQQEIARSHALTAMDRVYKRIISRYN